MMQQRLCQSAFKILLVALVLANFWLPKTAAGQSSGSQTHVDLLLLDDTIQPISAGRLTRAIATAQNDGAQALIVELNTPGGLLDSTRAMVGSLLTAPLPVLVYVGPMGARAASAGFYLLEAADVAAMAPGTNAGAAHPVSSMGKMDETMAHKVTNDAAAFLRSYVGARGRNLAAAEAAVEDSRAYSAEEALSLRLVEVVANTPDELLRQVDGRSLERMDGRRFTLHVAGAAIHELPPSAREVFFDWLMNPNLALLLAVVGGLLIYMEFNAPGTIVPGAVGTFMVLLSAFALNLLPIRYTSVLLLFAAFALLMLEAKFGGHGLLALTGLLALGFGAATLVDSPIPELAIMPGLAIALSLGFGLLTLFLLRLAWRAKRTKIQLGADALIGRTARALESLDKEGRVLVEGEIWRARSSVSVEAEALLLVTAHDGWLLEVSPVEANSPRLSL